MVPASRDSVYNTWHSIRPNQVCLYHDMAVCLLDLLRAPPTENKYEIIKTRLTKTFGLTHRVHANKLLQIGDLGDRMLLGLIDEMLSLLDGHQPCMLFEQLFLNQIPDAIRLQLADADFADPCKVAELADELWQSMRLSCYSTVHKVAWPPRQVQEANRFS